MTSIEDSDLRGLLQRHGFDVVDTAELLLDDSAPTPYGARAVITGRRRAGARTIEVQLQRYTYQGVHYTAVARFTGPGLVGEGVFRPIPLMNTPLVFLVVTAFTFGLYTLFHLASWSYRRFIEKMLRFDSVRSPASRRFQLEGRDAAAVADAFPFSRQEKLARIPFAGTATVGDGRLALVVKNTGYHRNIVAELMEGVDAITSADTTVS